MYSMQPTCTHIHTHIPSLFVIAYSYTYVCVTAVSQRLASETGVVIIIQPRYDKWYAIMFGLLRGMVYMR